MCVSLESEVRSSMNRRPCFHLLAVLALFVAVLAACDAPVGPPDTRLASGKGVAEYLVRFEAGADAQQVALDYLLLLTQYDPVAELGVLLGTIDPVLLLGDFRVKALQLNHLTAYSEPETYLQSFHEGDWVDSEIAAQPALAHLNLGLAHTATKGMGILVSVLDTGVDSGHDHLAGRLLMTSEIPPDLGQEETQNGLDDDFDGDTDEAYGHGTHVAGIVASVAPEATILPIRVLDDDGNGWSYDLARGLHYSQQLQADIVNLSLVLSDDSPVIHDFLVELDAAGIVVMAAAGNTPGTVGYPASDAYTVGVAATDVADALAPFSGSGLVSFAAPGVEVESSYPDNKSAIASGTSMATPVASAALALILSGEAPIAGQAGVALLQTSVVPVQPVEAVVDGRVNPTWLYRIVVLPEPRFDRRKLRFGQY